MEFPWSLLLLLPLILVLGCVLIIVYAVLRKDPPSPRLKIAAYIAAMPVIAMILLALMADNIDENPSFSSPAEIIGTYTDDENVRSLTVHADGTFTSRGLPEPTAGTWVHRDQGFTLTLTNNTTRSREVRFIRRNRTLCIAPEWEERHGHTDLFLEKLNP